MVCERVVAGRAEPVDVEPRAGVGGESCDPRRSTRLAFNPQPSLRSAVTPTAGDCVDLMCDEQPEHARRYPPDAVAPQQRARSVVQPGAAAWFSAMFGGTHLLLLVPLAHRHIVVLKDQRAHDAERLSAAGAGMRVRVVRSSGHEGHVQRLARRGVGDFGAGTLAVGNRLVAGHAERDSDARHFAPLHRVTSTPELGVGLDMCGSARGARNGYWVCAAISVVRMEWSWIHHHSSVEA